MLFASVNRTRRKRLDQEIICNWRFRTARCGGNGLASKCVSGNYESVFVISIELFVSSQRRPIMTLRYNNN